MKLPLSCYMSCFLAAFIHCFNIIRALCRNSNTVVTIGWPMVSSSCKRSSFKSLFPSAVNRNCLYVDIISSSLVMYPSSGSITLKINKSVRYIAALYSQPLTNPPPSINKREKTLYILRQTSVFLPALSVLHSSRPFTFSSTSSTVHSCFSGIFLRSAE